MKRELEVLYKTGKNGEVPTQGYSDDFGYDMYAAAGVLVPPLTFESVVIPTDLKTAFDPEEAGMHLSLRSGIAKKTPLILSNAPAVIEGSYRDGIGILVRNTFIDSSLVDFAFDVKGKRIPVASIPQEVRHAARHFYDEETEKLGYDKIGEEISKVLYDKVVPRGTIYIAKHDRVAQMFFAPKYAATFTKTDILPDSVRGEGGFGSSGTSKK